METQIFYKDKSAPGTIKYIVNATVSGNEATVTSASYVASKTSLVDVTDKINYVRVNTITDTGGNSYVQSVQVFCNNRDVTNVSVVQTTLSSSGSSEEGGESEGDDDSDNEGDSSTNAVVGTGIVGKAIVGKAA